MWAVTVAVSAVLRNVDTASVFSRNSLAPELLARECWFSQLPPALYSCLKPFTLQPLKHLSLKLVVFLISISSIKSYFGNSVMLSLAVGCFQKPWCCAGVLLGGGGACYSQQPLVWWQLAKPHSASWALKHHWLVLLGMCSHGWLP